MAKLAVYVFKLARFDEDYDLRDRGRLLGSLLADICPLLRDDLSILRDEHDGGEGNTHGVVTLRKEQLQMIIMSNKQPAKEEADPIGLLFSLP